MPIAFASNATPCQLERVRELEAALLPALEALMSSTYAQRFSVSFDYPVYFGWDVFLPTNPALVEAIRRREPTRCHRGVVVIEQSVAQHWPDLFERVEAYFHRHGDALQLAALPLKLPGGEEAKNEPVLVARLHDFFESARLDRQGFVVVIGGGAFQDLVGYAAATTHRGVRVVRVPTTVLSQNDSGVGVKNGVNAYGKKNFLGTFAPPFAVLDDFRFLESLSARDRAAGMAEAVKVALVKDAEFFGWLERHARDLCRFDMPVVAEMIQRCAVLHLRHIAEAGDPFELGSSRPLDFGHWSAHKLEALTNFDLRHGEAVSIGLCLDTRYSVMTGLTETGTDRRVVALLREIGLPVFDEALNLRHHSGRRLVFDGIDEFREHLGGDLTVMMLAAVGRGTEVTALDETLLGECIDWLESVAPSLPATRPSVVSSAVAEDAVDG